jgi:ubiquinone/menaquinone biosynthesis C-methylase UbiE
VESKDIRTACVVCRTENLKPVFEGSGFDDSSEKFTVLACPECGLGVTHPVPAPEALAKYYALSYYGSSEKKFNPLVEKLVRVANRHRAKELLRLLPKEKGRVLDIGCGRGNFLREMAAFGFECTGTDLAGFEFPSYPGVTFKNGDLAELALPSQSFDAVSIWHVLEHVRTPDVIVREVSRLLRPGGVFAVAVPHFSGVQGKLFGPHWFHLDLPRHLFHFSKRALFKMLDEHGFELLEVKTTSFQQNCFGFLQSALNRLFGGRVPNVLYTGLKHGGLRRLRGAAWGWFLLSLVLSPVLTIAAFIEELLAGAFSTGGSLIVYARRKRQ